MLHQYLPTKRVGRRIEDLIVEHRTSQAKLADIAGVSEATISRYISNEDSRIPHDVLLAIAKHFGVTTDFLLCQTDIPYRTNYDIEKLGLSAKAAQNLLTKYVNTKVVNQLLEHPDFAQLTEQISLFEDGTHKKAFEAYNQLFSITQKLLRDHAKIHPLDKRAAQKAIREVESNKLIPTVPETAMIQAAFSKIVADLTAQAEKNIQDCVMLNSRILEDFAGKLEQRQNTFDLRSVTIKDITDAVTEQVTEAGFPIEHAEELNGKLLELFNDMLKKGGKK